MFFFSKNARRRKNFCSAHYPFRGEFDRPERDKLVSLVGLFFAVPFVLFSMAGGFLADHYSKRQVTIATKIIELVAMALAVVALQRQALSFELAILFLIATQAALFGP